MANEPKYVASLHTDDGAWLRTVYAEAWKQYAHEDTLAQARSNVFLVTQAILIAFLATISAPLFKIGCATFGSFQLHLGFVFVGCVWSLAGVFLGVLGKKFEAVNEVGKNYVDLRHVNLRAIERLAGLGNLGPALLEHDFRAFRLSKKSGSFQPYAEHPQLSTYDDLRVAPYQGKGGFSYLNDVARLWGVIYVVITFIGILTLAMGMLAYVCGIDSYIPSLSCGP